MSELPPQARMWCSIEAKWKRLSYLYSRLHSCSSLVNPHGNCAKVTVDTVVPPICWLFWDHCRTHYFLPCSLVIEMEGNAVVLQSIASDAAPLVLSLKWTGALCPQHQLTYRYFKSSAFSCNRRSRYVRDTESRYWEHITAGCMTEESDDENGEKIVTHQLLWRSDCEFSWSVWV